jgi:hypothetical protein
MINYDNLEELMADTDFNYFAFISDNREIYGKLTGKIKEISGFYAVQKLVNRVSVEEYTNRVLSKVEQDGNIAIEKEVKKPEYRFIRTGVFKTTRQMLSWAINEPVICVFIDSGNTFDRTCTEFSTEEKPFIKINYNHGRFTYNGKKFSSINSLSIHLMENYYL